MLRAWMFQPGYERYVKLEDDDEESSKRWTGCLITGTLLLVFLLFFFGAIIYLQLHSELPVITVVNGTMSNYRYDSGDGSLYSSMELIMSADNPVSTSYRFSSSTLELRDEELGVIAPVQVEAFHLAKKTRNVPFRCYFSDSRWLFTISSQELARFSPPAVLQVVLQGDLQVHYQASKILSNVPRKIYVRINMNIHWS